MGSGITARTTLPGVDEMLGMFRNGRWGKLNSLAPKGGQIDPYS